MIGTADGTRLGLASKRAPCPAAWACCLLLLLAAGCRKGDAGAPAKRTTPQAAATPVPPPPRGKHIALMYSSNLLADYEQCGCPVHPMGGVARRATQIDRARAEADAVLVLDAGDLFLPLPARMAGKPAPLAEEIERVRGNLVRRQPSSASVS